MRELGSWIYRILRSKALGALVIIAMAVLALLGTLITQEPPRSAADPVSHAAFLESMQGRYGGWAVILDALGIFNLWSSPIFLGVTVLLALSIIACTVHRIPQLWKRATQPRVHVTPKFFDRAQYRASMRLPMAPQAALDHVGECSAATSTGGCRTTALRAAP
ncbi:cytochrome c biogenesis protein ResB [Tessaracoccus coleopterorum]|uniref:cytochrome c biogenesis protein ResB n=1 Tax=Tessaracoccus coleopterorum TaxID=2714950 RepID=UPI0018D47284|nr:cytochrome c biogenesis protein ResB [Tessaracoccus coleopterorum]